MKKILLTFFFGLAAVAGMAQTSSTYDESLIVSVNGQSSDPIPATIIVVHNEDGTINFSLKNFMLSNYDESTGEYAPIPVGNIDLNGISVEKKGNTEIITTNQTIEIKDGDLEEYEGQWFGPLLGEVPIVLNGKLDATHMYVTLDIDMSGIGQIIGVTVGKDEGFDLTAISSATIGQQNAASSAIYTIDGRRVSRATKGVYVVNGKKIIK